LTGFVIIIIAKSNKFDKLNFKYCMQFEFERTKSRLREMQALEYLQKPHRY
jgi:predicted ATPase